MLQTCLKYASRKCWIGCYQEVKVEEDNELMDRKNPECSGSEMIGRSVDGWRFLILLNLFLSFIKVKYL
jgi:hypothetical protein